MKYFFILILFLPLQALAQLELESAVRCDGGPVDKTLEQQEASLSLSKVAREKNLRIGGRCLGWTNMGEGNIWYVAAHEVGVFAIDSNQDKYLGGWPLTPYDEYLFLSGEYMAAVEEISEVHGESFSAPSNPLSIVTDRPVGYPLNQSPGMLNSVGCLQNAPLRYGDINEDGSEELVLFLGQNVIVFSTSLNEVIFSAHYWMNDELSTDEVEINFPGGAKLGDPLFIASSGTDVLVREKFPAWRSLSKLYFDDFSGDGSHDIVVWRKLYKSKSHGDEQGGFNRIGEVLVHYTLKEGKYHREQTPSSTVFGWLEDRNLTWKSGFPSKNECSGQENEFIPELHDPILNDPGVLQ